MNHNKSKQNVRDTQRKWFKTDTYGIRVITDREKDSRSCELWQKDRDYTLLQKDRDCENDIKNRDCELR